jgi:hypothetical protein
MTLVGCDLASYRGLLALLSSSMLLSSIERRA